jgi:hypothetical protein
VPLLRIATGGKHLFHSLFAHEKQAKLLNANLNRIILLMIMLDITSKRLTQPRSPSPPSPSRCRQKTCRPCNSSQLSLKVRISRVCLDPSMNCESALSGASNVEYILVPTGHSLGRVLGPPQACSWTSSDWSRSLHSPEEPISLAKPTRSATGHMPVPSDGSWVPNTVPGP